MILLIGGTFDHNGGKRSKIFDEIIENFDGDDSRTLNGGFVNDLNLIDFRLYSVIVWAPNIDNNEEKILGKIKEINPKSILVSSKQIRDNVSYTNGDIVGRLLKTKSNLGIVFDISKNPFNLKLVDPLGNCYYDGENCHSLGAILKKRISTLQQMNRAGSICLGERPIFEIDESFIDIVKTFGTEFSKHVNAINPNRLLGNASTRCSKGFPAVRSEQDSSLYYVSKRNVDKETISSEEFVAVKSINGLVGYFGENKPSVDSPIQIKVFENYPNINYIIHGHVYIDGGLTTQNKIPCGYVDEYSDINELYPDKTVKKMLINLKGHGCFIAVNTLDDFREIKFLSRVLWEKD